MWEWDIADQVGLAGLVWVLFRLWYAKIESEFAELSMPSRCASSSSIILPLKRGQPFRVVSRRTTNSCSDLSKLLRRQHPFVAHSSLSMDLVLKTPAEMLKQLYLIGG
ncbi:hypothetical protein CRG98_041007 [Punica granatum]|uniref:Uncharacterized protein n=1 Tax=Punica granatum TaxID=22663 RepID=A0A2I0I3L3_PUNGR|nr:hypothetical protein CRG98_041007 [Punica granatum]